MKNTFYLFSFSNQVINYKTIKTNIIRDKNVITLLGLLFAFYSISLYIFFHMTGLVIKTA